MTDEEEGNDDSGILEVFLEVVASVVVSDFAFVLLVVMHIL